MKRFERFNEMIFESYCMKSVLNAIKKERNRKDARGEVEQLSLIHISEPTRR